MFPVRPLRSTVVTRFSATTSLSDSRPGHLVRLFIPSTLLVVLPTALPGLPGSSTSLYTRAVPFHPGESGDCWHPFLHRRLLASTISEVWPLSYWCNEAVPGLLALRLTCSPPEASPVALLPLTLSRLLVARVIDKVNSLQFTRPARLFLAHRNTPSYTKEHEIRVFVRTRGWGILYFRALAS